VLFSGPISASMDRIAGAHIRPENGHLTPSQLAMVAVRLLEIEQERALKRKATSTGDINPKPVAINEPNDQHEAKLPQAAQGPARDIVAAQVGVNPRYSNREGRTVDM